MLLSQNDCLLNQKQGCQNRVGSYYEPPDFGSNSNYEKIPPLEVSMILRVCLFTMICTVYMSQGINILNGVLTYMKKRFCLLEVLDKYTVD